MSILPPECEQFLVSGYVLGNLSPAEGLLLEEMLAENPALNEQIIAMQAALDLAYAPPELAPPPSLRHRILTAANRDARLAIDNSVDNSVNSLEDDVVLKPRLPWNKIIGAIALATITALGITNYRLWQSVETAQTTNIQSEKQIYSLSSQDPTQEYTAKLIVSPDKLNATLAVSNLPTLPSDRVYALWTVVGKDVPYTTDEKGAILTAVFQVNESGDFTQEIAVPQPHLEPRTIRKIAITVEDISAPQAHLGSIFISTGN